MPALSQVCLNHYFGVKDFKFKCEVIFLHFVAQCICFPSNAIKFIVCVEIIHESFYLRSFHRGFIRAKVHHLSFSFSYFVAKGVYCSHKFKVCKPKLLSSVRLKHKRSADKINVLDDFVDFVKKIVQSGNSFGDTSLRAQKYCFCRFFCHVGRKNSVCRVSTFSEFTRFFQKAKRSLLQFASSPIGVIFDDWSKLGYSDPNCCSTRKPATECADPTLQITPSVCSCTQCQSSDEYCDEHHQFREVVRIQLSDHAFIPNSITRSSCFRNHFTWEVVCLWLEFREQFRDVRRRIVRRGTIGWPEERTQDQQSFGLSEFGFGQFLKPNKRHQQRASLSCVIFQSEVRGVLPAEDAQQPSNAKDRQEKALEAQECPNPTTIRSVCRAFPKILPGRWTIRCVSAPVAQCGLNNACLVEQQHGQCQCEYDGKKYKVIAPAELVMLGLFEPMAGQRLQSFCCGYGAKGSVCSLVGFFGFSICADYFGFGLFNKFISFLIQFIEVNRKSIFEFSTFFWVERFNKFRKLAFCVYKKFTKNFGIICILGREWFQCFNIQCRNVISRIRTSQNLVFFYKRFQEHLNKSHNTIVDGTICIAAVGYLSNLKAQVDSKYSNNIKHFVVVIADISQEFASFFRDSNIRDLHRYEHFHQIKIPFCSSNQLSFNVRWLRTNLTNFPIQRKVTKFTRKECGPGLEARLSRGARQRAMHLAGRVFSYAHPYEGYARTYGRAQWGAFGLAVSSRAVFQPAVSPATISFGRGVLAASISRRPAMSTTGDGRRASARPRDTPDHLFDLILKLHAEHYHLQGLMCALAVVVNELRETPEVSQLPAVTAAAEALSAAMLRAQERHLQSLEVLERARFRSEGEVV